MEKRTLGRTSLPVTPLCVGTSALGSFPEQYGYAVGTDVAVATIRRTFAGPINFIDTSNEYGHGGDSERRIGIAIREAGGLPPGFVLATKVDPLPGSSDFSGDRVRRSVEESLERLGLERLQIVYLHDPEKMTFEAGMASGGAVEAMVKMRDEGVIAHLGVAGGPIDLMLRYLSTDLFDSIISHNRYTLVDQSAEPLIETCMARDVGFVNAAPYGGGMLVKGPDAVPRYCYAPASAATLTRVRAMEALCKAHDVPLAAAALQFSTRDARVASTIVGMSTPARLDETLALLDHPIDETLWAELRPFIEPGRSGVI
ncbi:MAG: aldo/keto reductase [Bauldia sp.]|nr:aldo/keto reductase [Bauldia sp.]